MERDPVLARAYEFARIRRRIKVFRRNGLEVKPEFVSRALELDRWLTDNTTWWKSNYGYTKTTH